MPQTPTAPLTRRQCAWRLAWLCALCGALYRASNQISAARPDAHGGVLAWDHAIPFVDWTVWPYLSIVLPFAAAFLRCGERGALDRLSLRLLLALGLALACYALVPLRFAFERPASAGLTGLLFEGLAAFDLPYNRAPSLHIAVLVILWSQLAGALNGWRRGLLAGWFGLIAVSVLTTWQHHLIDVPAGLALGLVTLALTPPRRAAQASAWLASTSARTASVNSAFRPAKTGVVFTE